jgi:hypothetical protein
MAQSLARDVHQPRRAMSAQGEGGLRPSPELAPLARPYSFFCTISYFGMLLSIAIK